LKAFSKLTVVAKEGHDAAHGACSPVGEDEVSDKISSLQRKASSRAQPRSRRGSQAAMEPFLVPFEPFDGTGAIEKVCVIGSGSWGTALARLAALNVVEKDGFDETVNFWVREREVSLFSPAFPLVHH
jgi:hypothetical protein